jgi:preprotein translocase subunit SecF
MMKLFPLRLIPDNTAINFMRWRFFNVMFSVVLVLGSIIHLSVFGLNLGIDFRGGILLETRFEHPTNIAVLRDALSALHIGEVSIQQFGTPNDIMIRLGPVEQTVGAAASTQADALFRVKEALARLSHGDIEYRKIDHVGPQVGGELIRGGILALVLGFVAIMIYLSIRFEWQYGIGAIISLIHDAIVTLGFMSLTRLECNQTTIAALLTIIGYSVNDSVVIYDRIRENIRVYKKMPIIDLLNKSINDTLSRTVMTVLTTLLAALALILFGGEVIHSFSIAVFFGIVMGTYSSIFVSAPVLGYLNLRRAEPKITILKP